MFANRKTFITLDNVGDAFFVLLSFISAALIAQPLNIFLSKNFHLVLLPILILVWLVTSDKEKLYNDLLSQSYMKILFFISKQTIIQISVATLFLFFIKENLFTRNFIVFYGLLTFSFMTLKQVLMILILKKSRLSPGNKRKLVIIGRNDQSKKFAERLLKLDTGFEVVNIFELNEENIEAKLEEFIINNNVTDVLISTSDIKIINSLILLCDYLAVKSYILPDYLNFISGKMEISLFNNTPLLSIRSNPLEEYQYRFIKRLFDLTFSITLFILVLWWLLPIISIIIMIDSKGSPLFIQKRIGKDNNIFNCYKFRTMTKASSQKENFKPVEEGDSRITKVGSFLRKTNLDELPQFLNVIKGDMSIVGPRPHAISFNNNYEKIVKEIKLRHRIKPGITGWAQIHGLRGDVFDFEENKRRTQLRIDHDIWYIENWSFFLDIKIIIDTILQVIKRENKGL